MELYINRGNAARSLVLKRLSGFSEWKTTSLPELRHLQHFLPEREAADRLPANRPRAPESVALRAGLGGGHGERGPPGEHGWAVGPE